MKNLTIWIVFIAVFVDVSCGGMMPSGPSDVKAKSGRFQLTIPGGWSRTDRLNDAADIQVMNGKEEMYAMVLEYSKKDFGVKSVEDFGEYLINDIVPRLENGAVKEKAEKTNVNGMNGVRHIVTGEVNKVNIVYMLFTVENGQSYYQILAWTLPSLFEKNVAELENVVQSFKVLKNTEVKAENPSDVIGKMNSDGYKSVTSKDGSMSVELPSGWSLCDDLNKDADFQATNPMEEGYFIVLTEYKVDFDRIDYMKHSEMTRSNMLQFMENSDITRGPEHLVINGKPAVLYEIHGTVDNIRIYYIHVTIDGEDGFHQLLGWTIPSHYKKNKSVLESIIKSFKEE